MPKKESKTPALLACEDRLAILDLSAEKVRIPSWVVDAAEAELEAFARGLDATKKPAAARDAAKKCAGWRTSQDLNDIVHKNGVAKHALKTFIDEVDYAYRFIERAWRQGR